MASPTTENGRRKAAASQEFLPIDSVRDGIAILRGGMGLRMVLMVSAINFSLKSDEEQDAIVYQYENFLNSLDFPIQLVVHSRRLNIGPYLDTLGARQQEETNDLLKVQIGEYIEFVRTFVELSQIVQKTFFAVVPFQPSIAERHGGILGGLTSIFRRGGDAHLSADDEEFAKWRVQLSQRADAVALGLRRLGLRVVPLNTEELVELFYGLYNPTESQRVRAEESANTFR